MADGDDSVSLVGATPRSSHSIDQFRWDHAALNFADVSVAEHERRVRTLGTGAASEVLLMIIADKCGTDKRKWQEARDLGIPWQDMRWTHLGGLMENYNAAVGQTKGADSAPRDLPRRPPAPRSEPPPAPGAGASASKTADEEDPWPASDAQTSSKKVSRKRAQKNLKAHKCAKEKV